MVAVFFSSLWRKIKRAAKRVWSVVVRAVSIFVVAVNFWNPIGWSGFAWILAASFAMQAFLPPSVLYAFDVALSIASLFLGNGAAIEFFGEGIFSSLLKIMNDLNIYQKAALFATQHFILYASYISNDQDISFVEALTIAGNDASDVFGAIASGIGKIGGAVVGGGLGGIIKGVSSSGIAGFIGIGIAAYFILGRSGKKESSGVNVNTAAPLPKTERAQVDFDQGEYAF